MLLEFMGQFIQRLGKNWFDLFIKNMFLRCKILFNYYNNLILDDFFMTLVDDFLGTNNFGWFIIVKCKNKEIMGSLQYSGFSTLLTLDLGHSCHYTWKAPSFFWDRKHCHLVLYLFLFKQIINLIIVSLCLIKISYSLRLKYK
jgi:hypothetical protein